MKFDTNLLDNETWGRRLEDGAHARGHRISVFAGSDEGSLDTLENEERQARLDEELRLKREIESERQAREEAL